MFDTTELFQPWEDISKQDIIPVGTARLSTMFWWPSLGVSTSGGRYPGPMLGGTIPCDLSNDAFDVTYTPEPSPMCPLTRSSVTTGNSCGTNFYKFGCNEYLLATSNFLCTVLFAVSGDPLHRHDSWFQWNTTISSYLSFFIPKYNKTLICIISVSFSYIKKFVQNA